MPKKIIFGCLTPIILIGGGVWWAFRSMGGAAATPERFHTVGRGTVEAKVTETGVIEPLKKVEVKSKVAGRVKTLLVEEGSVVEAKRIVAEIDPTEVNSQVAQLEAQLDGSRARLQQVTRGAGLQVKQTGHTIREVEQAVRTAEARLRVAEEQATTQPRLTGSAVAQAEASLKASRDNLEMIRSSTHPQAVTAVESGHEEAKAAEENARRNLDRQQKLLERGFVSQQVVDSARSELASMVARLQQAKKRLDLIGDQNRLEVAAAESRIARDVAALETARANSMQVALTKHERDAARAALAQAREQLASAKSNRMQDTMKQDEIAEARASVKRLENQIIEVKVRQRDTTLVAPLSGVVTKRYVEVGELLTSGVSSFSSGTPVMQIADLSKMLVKISVNEVDVQRVSVGLPVEIRIDAARDAVFRGRVTRVSPAAIGAANPTGDQQAIGRQGGGGGGSVVRFAVEVTIDRPDPRLRPGMSAKCAIIIARRENVLRLLNEGIQGTGERVKVLLVKPVVKDGKTINTTVDRQVRVGVRGESHVEICEGLKEGDQVKPAPFTGPKRKDLGLEIE